MDFETIKVQTTDRCQVILFNRPELFNAMNKLMKKEIISAIKLALKNSPRPSCIILSGEGKAFSAGQDLNDRSGLVDLGQTLATEWNPLIQAISSCPLPVLGAINGVCAGAGLSVALACDWLCSGEQTKFVSGFAQIGLAPDAGSTHILTRHLGKYRAFEFFVGKDPLLGKDLHQVGVVNQLSDNPLECALEQAQKLAGLPPLSLSLIKTNIAFAQDHSLDQTIAQETATQRFLGRTEDYQEGVKAFHEKRPAKFSGR